MRIYLFIFMVLSQICWAETISGKVIRIADGDTITILRERTQYKIRLNGIDAPESSQAFGQKSKQALGSFLEGKSVSVETTEKDHYGRYIGTVFANGANANVWMVHNGWAWHYKKYSNDAKLAQLELEAKASKRGLWNDSSTPIAPWEYRSLKKQSAAIKKGDAVSLGYWLNTSSGSRHNSSCRYYKNTKQGRVCKPSDGKACGICGG